MELNIKDKKLVFTYESKEYCIPGELYPLTSEDLDDIFFITTDGVSEIRDARLLRILDTLQLDMGRCYENSEKIYQALKEKGYDVHFFSGWLFTGRKPPLHHAWIMVEVEGARHLIDSADNKVVAAISRKFRERQSIDTMEESRKIFIDLYQKELKKRKRNTDRMTTGKPPEGFAYLGMESNFEETVNLYQELIKTKNHPSYNGGVKLGGDSIMQEELKKQNLSQQKKTL